MSVAPCLELVVMEDASTLWGHTGESTQSNSVKLEPPSLTASGSSDSQLPPVAIKLEHSLPERCENKAHSNMNKAPC